MSDDWPEIGEIVTVLTRHHGGEHGRVVAFERTRKGSYRVFFRLESVNGSLYGAQGWYEPHEFTRTEAAL